MRLLGYAGPSDQNQCGQVFVLELTDELKAELKKKIEFSKMIKADNDRFVSIDYRDYNVTMYDPKETEVGDDVDQAIWDGEWVETDLEFTDDERTRVDSVILCVTDRGVFWEVYEKYSGARFTSHEFQLED
jgi:hypothetical protein